jgi:hypothetical protein
MRILSLFAIATLFVSCGRYFAPDRHLKRHVQESELVGEWNLRSSSLEILARDGYVQKSSSRHTLAIREDGSLTFVSAYPDSDGIQHITAKGRWGLQHHDDRTTTLEISMRFGGSDHIEAFSFADEDGRIVLWQTYGDPDMWEFVEYTKN